MDGWSLAIVAALVLVYAGCSRRLERTVLTGPILFVGAGLLVGSEGLGWLDPRLGSSAVRVLADATLTLMLFADASRIDIRALRREIALPARLLGLGLPLTIVAGTAIAVGLFTPAGLARGARACDRPGADRRGARTTGRDGPAPAGPRSGRA